MKLPLLAATMLVITGVLVTDAEAAYTVSIRQHNANVVATGTGTLNLGALTYVGALPAGAGIMASPAAIVVGPASAPAIPTYAAEGGITGPLAIGPGHTAVMATSGTGDKVGFSPSAAYIGVPYGYQPGDTLTGTATWTNTTISDLGLAPGTYTWTWGSGSTADRFTILVGDSSVPTLSQWGLLLATLLVVCSTAWTLRPQG